MIRKRNSATFWCTRANYSKSVSMLRANSAMKEKCRFSGIPVSVDRQFQHDRTDVRTCGRADVRTCGRADWRTVGRAHLRLWLTCYIPMACAPTCFIRSIPSSQRPRLRHAQAIPNDQHEPQTQHLQNLTLQTPTTQHRQPPYRLMMRRCATAQLSHAPMPQRSSLLLQTISPSQRQPSPLTWSTSA